MKELLEFILTNLVDYPDQIEITQENQDGEEIYSIKVAPEDMGKIIGKNGQIIRALRTITRTAAFKQNKKARINLQDINPQTQAVSETNSQNIG